MCIYMYFQQAAQEGQKRSEWAKIKKRLMAFFTGDAKVNGCVGLFVVLFLCFFCAMVK